MSNLSEQSQMPLHPDAQAALNLALGGGMFATALAATGAETTGMESMHLFAAESALGALSIGAVAIWVHAWRTAPSRLHGSNIPARHPQPTEVTAYTMPALEEWFGPPDERREQARFPVQRHMARWIGTAAAVLAGTGLTNHLANEATHANHWHLLSESGVVGGIVATAAMAGSCYFRLWRRADQIAAEHQPADFNELAADMYPYVTAPYTHNHAVLSQASQQQHTQSTN